MLKRSQNIRRCYPKNSQHILKKHLQKSIHRYAKSHHWIPKQIQITGWAINNGPSHSSEVTISILIKNALPCKKKGVILVSLLCGYCVILVWFWFVLFLFFFFRSVEQKLRERIWNHGMKHIYISYISYISYHILDYVFIISWCKYTTCWDLPINPLGFTMIYPSIGHGITSPVNVFHRPRPARGVT